MTWPTVLLIGFGGFVGTLMRFGLQRGMQAWLGSALPWGILAANVLGCLLAGYVVGLGQRDFWHGHWQTVLLTGVCGGFTTFSALMIDVQGLMQSERWGTLAAYVALTVVLGLGAVYLGLRLAR